MRTAFAAALTLALCASASALDVHVVYTHVPGGSPAHAAHEHALAGMSYDELRWHVKDILATTASPEDVVYLFAAKNIDLFEQEYAHLTPMAKWKALADSMLPRGAVDAFVAHDDLFAAADALAQRRLPATLTLRDFALACRLLFGNANVESPGESVDRVARALYDEARTPPAVVDASLADAVFEG